jgi:hypothetical protein
MPSGEEIEENALYKATKYLDSAKDERTANNTMRHQYRVLSDKEKDQMILIKGHGALLLGVIEGLGSKREYSIAKTKLEEAVMWTVKGLTQ